MNWAERFTFEWEGEGTLLPTRAAADDVLSGDPLVEPDVIFPVRREAARLPLYGSAGLSGSLSACGGDPSRHGPESGGLRLSLRSHLSPVRVPVP